MLERLTQLRSEPLTPDAARYLLGFRFTEEDRSRLQELADRSQDGTLSEEEGREFDSYLHIGNLLAVDFKLFKLDSASLLNVLTQTPGHCRQ